MNKTYLIAGGASVASLAVGAAGGYFFAKKQFTTLTEARVAEEVEKTRKHFGVLMTNMQYGKPDLMDVVSPHPDEEFELEGDPDGEVLDPEDVAIVENATEALTNYQGFAKPDLSDVGTTKHNIFDQPVSGKKLLPPRDPTTGHFVSKKQTETEEPAKREPDDPYLIEPDVFLANDPDHDQESLLFFAKDDTLILVADNETVDVGLVGAANLTLFAETDYDADSVIYVRNEKMETDYQITRTYESLTTHMGLGEDDEELEDDYADLGQG